MPTSQPHDRWGDAEFTRQLERVQWMGCPMVRLHLNERSTGSAARDWLTAWAPQFFPEGDLRVLVLGCGEGWLERALARRPRIAQIDAIDFAAGAVERARDQARAEGLGNVTYRVGDLNVEPLERDAYDVVIAHSVLHHVERLEHALAEIEAALKANGTLLINEYAGPRRFQYGDDIDEMLNELLRAIPERYRRGTIEPGIYFEKRRATEAEIAVADPTEAVRSDELLPMIAARFEVVDRCDLGGTILQHLLYDIAPNFDLNDPLARSIIELLCVCESALVDARAIPSDYALVAARKRGGPPLQRRTPELPPLPPEVLRTTSDPLGFGPKRRLQDRTGSSANELRPWMLHALRVALLARRPGRPILNPRSPIREAIEHLRFALRRERRQGAHDHLLARVPADSEIRPLLETVLRIAVRRAL